MKRLITTVVAIAVLLTNNAKAQRTFNNLDSLLSYATAQSTTLQSGEIKMSQAQKAKFAAIIGVLDPIGSASYTYTNNTKLQTSLFPGETFGGEPGTYKEVKMGMQYSNSLTNYNEVKLVNIPGWANFKLASINIDLTGADNKITQKSFYENVAISYHNILNIQEQLKATEQNLAASDSLLQIAKHKYEQGLVKLQDVNDTKANYINTNESCNQLKYMLQQQYLGLKILTDIPETDSIIIIQPVGTTAMLPKIEYNDINLKSSELREKAAFASYRQLQTTILPTLSFVNSNSTLQYPSSAQVYSNSDKWYKSSYIGLKFSVAIPSANTVSQRYKAKYDYQLAQQNTVHIKNKTELEYKQLGIDYNKAISQWESNTEVYELKKESYEKNLNLYSEGLLSLDQTLNSYNAMVNSNYNRISSAINVLLTQSKIEINNRIK
ncbi:MAG: TolC family protein [Chloroflexia bacterium]|nr:TolC family protein [Chloroflexia bacterium]